jgi:hypothetical protein
MKYLFLAYEDENRSATMSTSARDAFERACLANDKALRESGHLLMVEALQRNNTTTVQVHNGKVSVTDCPLTAANEQLVWLFFIDARDLNEAIQVAAQMPQASGGPIEVRSMMETGE